MSGLFPCDLTWEGTGGARGMFGLFRLANFPVHALSYGFQYIVRSALRVEQTAASFLPKLVQLLI